MKYKLDSLEGLSDEMKALYEEKDGAFYLKVEGDINPSFPQNNSRHGGILGNNYANDVFLWFNAGGESGSNIQWKRTFTPVYATGVLTKPTLKYFITSPLSSKDQVKNTAPGPFWRRYPNSIDELYMSSSILNQTYYNENNQIHLYNDLLISN